VNRYARTSPGQSLEIISIERPYSFFDLIGTRFSGCRPLGRLFSQVRMQQGQTMVIEKLGTPEDLREENEDFADAQSRPGFQHSVSPELFHSQIHDAARLGQHDGQRLPRLRGGEGGRRAVVCENPADLRVGPSPAPP
jgi:hypothetical protein